MSTDTMIAWWLDGPGEPSAFQRIALPVPSAKPGWLVVRLRAFGLNRSELFSRRGMSSPDFSFPRVLGLEAVGEVLDGSDSDLAPGQRVMCLMGGMGRSFHGGYASHLLVPRRQVFAVDTSLSFTDWGAIPETYNTAWQVCEGVLALDGTEKVLIRGGTSALGMACAEIAKDRGCTVITTSRKPDKLKRLEEMSRADGFVLDGDDFTERVLQAHGPMTAVVECVGAKATIESSCATMTGGGKLSMVGQLSESWDTDSAPEIPKGITSGFARSDLVASPDDDGWMKEVIARVEAGRYRPNIHRVFSFDELPEAHRVMGANEAVGKLVVEVAL